MNRHAARTVAALVLLTLAAAPPDEHPGKLGAFESDADVGTAARPGSAEFNADRAEYRITGSGGDIWGKQDSFHFLYRKAAGDLALTADVRFEGEGKVKHRKGCLMVRQSLSPDSPFADVAVHGDGLIALQYRTTTGAAAETVHSTVKAPATVRLERRGDKFTLLIATKGQPFQPAGSANVTLHDPVYCGLAVSSHDAQASETAVFAGVSLNKD
jgi:regulation of enolase protein 1 (concanavalin A-like superfamily)